MLAALLLGACAPSSPVRAPETLDLVATRFSVASAERGADLDDDGVPDNAIAGLGSVLDPLVAERLATNVHVVVMQLSDVGPGPLDRVRVGVFPAVDTDTDGADNESGVEVFDATGFVDEDGVALDSDPGLLQFGSWSAFVRTDTFQVGDFVFEIASGIHLAAESDESGASGVAAIGVTTDALAQALTDEGVDPLLVSLLADLADLDGDGDGVADTVSMAFTFDAAPCELAPPAR